MLSGTYYINSRGSILNHGCTVQSLDAYYNPWVKGIQTGTVKNTLLRNTENI